MQFTIFTRMVIGCLAVFIPIAGVSAYAISQLSVFQRVTAHILQVDNRMRDYEKKLADSILAQARYERKYVVAKDEELHDQYKRIGQEVSRLIEGALFIADTEQKIEVLTRIRHNCERYQSLFDAEVELMQHPGNNDRNDYRKEKERVFGDILEDLKGLKSFTEQDTYAKIKSLGESGAKATKLAIILGAGFVFSGVLISIFITRSITSPLFQMRKKTSQVAQGDFGGSLDLCSPPEIGELAKDLNLMCVKLREMDKIKADFFSLMAHELRTPLSAIKEGTNLLEETIGQEVKGEPKKILAIITEESNRLIELVNSLLDLSKLEAGMMTFSFKTEDIRPIINKAVSGMELLARAKNVSIEVKMEQELPFVQMDGERIFQALRNLIGNALKFSPKGSLVTVSALCDEEGLRVCVADAGPGIRKEDLNAVFDKFKQATITGFGKIKGTGLGLAIVKHIINAHGGEVWVESDPGHGSTFFFLLPS